MEKDLYEPLLMKTLKYNNIDDYKSPEKEVIKEIPFSIIKDGKWNDEWISMDWFLDTFTKEQRLGIEQRFRNFERDINKFNSIFFHYCIFVNKSGKELLNL